MHYIHCIFYFNNKISNPFTNGCSNLRASAVTDHGEALRCRGTTYKRATTEESATASIIFDTQTYIIESVQETVLINDDDLDIIHNDSDIEIGHNVDTSVHIIYPELSFLLRYTTLCNVAGTTTLDRECSVQCGPSTLSPLDLTNTEIASLHNKYNTYTHEKEHAQ